MLKRSLLAFTSLVFFARMKFGKFFSQVIAVRKRKKERKNFPRLWKSEVCEFQRIFKSFDRGKSNGWLSRWLEEAIEAIARREDKVDWTTTTAINQTGKKLFVSIKNVTKEWKRKQIFPQRKPHIFIHVCEMEIWWKVKIKVFLWMGWWWRWEGIILVSVGCYFKMLSIFFSSFV